MVHCLSSCEGDDLSEEFRGLEESWGMSGLLVPSELISVAPSSGGVSIGVDDCSRRLKKLMLCYQVNKRYRI